MTDEAGRPMETEEEAKERVRRYTLASPQALARSVWKRLYAPNLRNPASATPRLVILSGLPLSGKTYLAREIVKASTADVAHIENDHIREIVVADLVGGKPAYLLLESDLTYATSHELIRTALEARFHVVFDATNLNESFRRTIYRIADTAGAETIVIRVCANLETTMARSDERTSGRNGKGHSTADAKVYNLLIKEDEPISKCSRPILVYDSSKEDAVQFIRKNGLMLA